MRLASSAEVVNGEGMLGGGLIPEPPEQAGEGLRQGPFRVTPPAPAHTVLLQALRQQHLPCAQRTAPPCICPQPLWPCNNHQAFSQSDHARSAQPDLTCYCSEMCQQFLSCGQYCVSQPLYTAAGT